MNQQFDIAKLKALQIQATHESPEVGQRLAWLIYFCECGSVSATCRHFGIARTTFYRWSRRFDPQNLTTLKDVTVTMVPVAAPVAAVQPAVALPVAQAQIQQAALPRPCSNACAVQPYSFSFLRSAALVTSILFNLALASLIVFTALIEGQPSSAKTPGPVTSFPGYEQQSQAPASPSLLHTLLGIDIAQAATGIYRPINYQGKLTNSGGIAISNGNYNLRFKIFSAASGGNLVWSETWDSGTQRVTATGGLFSIALGTHTAMTGSVNFNSDSLFLQIEFDPGNDGVYEEVFSPRRRFASVPYAHNANSLDGLDSTQFIRSDISYTASGTLTISPRDATKMGIDILSTAGNAATGALRLSTQGANHIIFGSGGVTANYDTNLYRASANILKTDDSFHVAGTLSGKTLVVSGNASVTGSLVVAKNISGAALEVLGTASGRHLFAQQTLVSSGTLTVEGMAYIGQDVQVTNGRSYTFGSTNTRIEGSSVGGSEYLAFQAGSEYMRIIANGNVGIATSLPETTLEVSGTISGKTLTITGNGSFSGSLRVVGGFSGSVIKATTISGVTLIASGTGTKPLLFTSSPWAGVGIGTATPTQRLTVSGGSILNIAGGTVKALSGVNLAADTTDVVVIGRYAYTMALGSSNQFRITDISSPTAPRIVSSLTVGNSTSKSLAVSGKYAYVGTTVNAQNSIISVIDITNPAVPVIVAKLDLGDTINVQSLVADGKHLYVGRGQNFSSINEFQIVDISNPFTPRVISGLDMGSSIGVYSIAIQGEYAYVGIDDDAGGANEFRMIDIGNPNRPLEKGGLSLSADVNAVSVAGRFAYIGLATVTGNDFRIVDISNPASLTTVGGLDFSTDVLSVDVAGRYAYVGLSSVAGNDFRVINISNPALPSVAGGTDLSTAVRDVVAAGKYVYAGLTAVAGADLVILDINGIDTPSATIGTLGVELLYVSRNATVANTLSVLNSLNVGVGGIKSDGMLSITVGSGSAVSGLTGAIIVNRGMSGTVLALDSWAGNSMSSGAFIGSGKYVPHLLFGYRGQFDTSLFRSGTGQLTTSGTLVINDMRSKALLKLESGQNSQSENIVEVYSKSTSTYPESGARNFVWRMEGDGEVYADGAYNATGADYAEWFSATDSTLQPGEAVCLDVTKEMSVKRCDRSGDPNIMGVISTRPAFIGNRFGATANGKPKDAALVGLIGQLPAKASAENGPIAVGDAMAAASKPGLIRKAKAGESTVGVALKALQSGEGEIEILITRRNQSDLVEKIENEVTQSIADMHIEDDVRQMVQSAMSSANINGTVAAAVQAQVQQLNITSLINSVLTQRLADGSLSLLANGSLATDVLSTVEGEHGQGIADAVALRLGMKRGTGSMHLAGDLLVEGSLDVQQDVLMRGTLHAAAMTGPIRFDGPILPGADFAVGALSFSGASVNIGSLADPGALQVLGDVTIDGLAVFLGSVEVQGELIVSANQAGFATIPARSNGVTITFGTGFASTPVINATPNGRVGSEWWVDAQSQTGFVLRTDKPVQKDVKFSWTALGVRNAHAAATSATAAAALTTFHVDAEGKPYSTVDSIWNACIRNPDAFDACRGYHQGTQWFAHPDIVAANGEVLPFVYDPALGPSSLNLPASYAAVTVDVSAAVSSSTSSSAAPAEEAPASSSSAESTVVSSSSSQQAASSESSAAAEPVVSSSAGTEAATSSASSAPSVDDPASSQTGTSSSQAAAQ